MCGIVGYCEQEPSAENIKILGSLVEQVKIRGLHSFGFSYCNPELKTIKKHSIDEISFPKAKKIIYHNRYSTSGDYKDHKNNQPIQIGGISMAFNGVIDMRTKKEMEGEYGIKMETDNDGEVLLRLCGVDNQQITDFVKKMKGSFAGLFLTDDNRMIAIRNENRPLWRLEINNALFYASTKDVFKRVNPEFEPQELKPYLIYES